MEHDETIKPPAIYGFIKKYKIKTVRIENLKSKSFEGLNIKDLKQLFQKFIFQQVEPEFRCKAGSWISHVGLRFIVLKCSSALKRL